MRVLDDISEGHRVTNGDFKYFKILEIIYVSTIMVHSLRKKKEIKSFLLGGWGGNGVASNISIQCILMNRHLFGFGKY